MKYTKRDFLLKVWVRPLGWTWCVGSKGQIAIFSEHCYVAYQIKGNQVCSNMVANILPADPSPPPPPPPPPPHTHTHLPQNMVMLHIKLKVIRNTAKC